MTRRLLLPLGLSRRGLPALLLAAVLGALAGGPAEAAVARAPRRPEVSVTPQQDGSFLIQARSYRALVGADGNLHSLRVGETEMLDDRSGISLGCFFYADGSRHLTQLQRRGTLALEATDGAYSARYRFGAQDIRVTLGNSTTKPVSYFAVLSAATTIASRPGTTEAAAVPANERWGAARFTAAGGEYLEFSGGSRIWGPWLGRQVWEVSRVPAGGKQEIRISAGSGPPPRATLEQLVGIQADVVPPSGLVESGQPIALTVSLENRSDRDLQGALSLELSACRGDMVVFTSSSAELPARRLSEQSFQWRVAAPDFYTMRVSARLGGREIGEAQAVAGYEASSIRPQVPRPEGFAGFWQRLLADVGSEPPQYLITRDERLSRQGVEVWVAQFQSIAGKTIYGWYVAPENAANLPAMLYLSGYGARPIQPPVAIARHGWVVLAIDVRGNRVDRVRARPFEDYLARGIESPESYVYREIAGHALRAVAFLRARQEVDPSRICVAGVSEGGGVGLIVAALSPDIRAVAADAPMLVDFPLSLRASSWPYADLARLMNQRPKDAPRMLRTLSYFDVVNFADSIHSPALLSIGLLDSVSLPAAVQGLYNLLPGPKEMQVFPKAGHEGGGEDHWTYKLEWLSRALSR
jgi:cephalosporin-C deacetylase